MVTSGAEEGERNACAVRGSASDERGASTSRLITVLPLSLRRAVRSHDC